MGKVSAAMTLAVALSMQSAAAPFWGAKASLSIDTPLSRLQHGEFIWMGEAIAAGPLVMVVSLTEQKAYVYRNGVLIGVSTVSTGRRGYETPTGVFTILQKDKDHRSTIYDGAPMPYMQRLTWGGIALHAGGLPGYPTSHGCVHLPSEFARMLFGVSTPGMTVVVSKAADQPDPVVHPGYLAPVDAKTGSMLESAQPPAEQSRWQPQLAPVGPLSVVISRADQRVLVYRNGIEIGRSRLSVRGAEPLGTHALVLIEGTGRGPNPLDPDRPSLKWIIIDVPGHAGSASAEVDAQAASRIQIPLDFVRQVYPLLVPGTTVLVTDAAVLPTTTGSTLEVINADPPAR